VCDEEGNGISGAGVSVLTVALTVDLGVPGGTASDGTWALDMPFDTPTELTVRVARAPDGALHYSSHVVRLTFEPGQANIIEDCMVIPFVGELTPPGPGDENLIEADGMVIEWETDTLEFPLGTPAALGGRKVGPETLVGDAIPGYEPIALWAFAPFDTRLDTDLGVPIVVDFDAMPDLVGAAGGPGSTIAYLEQDRLTGLYTPIGTTVIDADGEQTGEVMVETFTWVVAAVEET
jgi:hypothetical protein